MARVDVVDQARRRAALRLIAAVAAAGASVRPALGVMAGTADGELGDSPERRVDPNTTHSPWAGVGALVTASGVFGGALISPRHVLTAAHVVANAATENVTYVLNFGRDASQRLAASSIHVHPEFRGAGAGQLIEHDIAVVGLREAAAEGVPIYPMLAAPLQAGQRIVFVGYGSSGFGEAGVSVGAAAHIKRVGANRIDQFIPARDNADRRIGFLFDFDGPALDSNVIGPPVGSNGSLGNRAESTFAGGDSGSPSFVRDRRGRWIVMGVNTFVGQAPGKAPGVFGSIGGGMLVSAYLDWIESVASEAGTLR